MTCLRASRNVIRRLVRLLSGPAKSVLNFVYPPFCMLCGAALPEDIALVCSCCWDKLPRANSKPGSSSAASSEDLEILSLWSFQDSVQQIIHEMKFRRKTTLAERIGRDLGEFLATTGAAREVDIIIPVPLHSSRKRERGFNQSEILARAISSHTGIPTSRDALRRQHSTRSQAKLNAEQRQENVKGVFVGVAGADLKGRIVLLVDDVTTTGATLKACATALVEAGARKVRAVTAAETPLPDEPVSA